MAQTTEQAPAKRGRKPGQTTTPKAVRDMAFDGVDLSGATDAELVRPPGRYDAQVRWSFEQDRWLQAVAQGYIVRKVSDDGQLARQPYDAKFKPGKDTGEASVSPEEHAKMILAEIRKSATALGYGLRTQPFVTGEDGFVFVQAKARKAREVKKEEEKATA
jgi:hypothetical protein